MSYRFSDHLDAAKAARSTCPSCDESVAADTEECPCCGATLRLARRTKARTRWFTIAAWLLILGFLAPLLLWLFAFLR